MFQLFDINNFQIVPTWKLVQQNLSKSFSLKRDELEIEINYTETIEVGILIFLEKNHHHELCKFYTLQGFTVIHGIKLYKLSYMTWHYIWKCVIWHLYLGRGMIIKYKCLNFADYFYFYTILNRNNTGLLKHFDLHYDSKH